MNRFVERPIQRDAAEGAVGAGAAAGGRVGQVPYGVQIYDQDAHIVFFNRASKEQLLGIPLDQTLQGQALLDVFAVRPDYSTTMTRPAPGQGHEPGALTGISLPSAWS